MITMSKEEAEKKLNKKLTNQEYCQYIHQLNFGNKTKTKKQTVKKASVNNVLSDDKAEFLKTVKENEKEVNYYSKSYEFALKFDDNFLLFRKPDIKTSFCFGHGQNGISTEEQEKNARSMMKYADTNSKYFVDENLKPLNESIETMKMLLTKNNKYDYCMKKYAETKDYFYRNLAYINKIYLCKNNNNTLYLYYTENPDYDNRLKYCTVIKELEKEDIERILNIYEKQKENFEKRLNTYLKKYGLSKLHTWTYLVD